MRIYEITEDFIRFDNGNIISYFHHQDCCEDCYADFLSLKGDRGLRYIDFDEKLEFDFVKECGFRFGNGINKVFVPCYCDQNGYYSSDIIIYYGTPVLYGIAETRI